jgi:hypothetical protein
MMQQRGQYEAIDQAVRPDHEAAGFDEDAKHVLMVSEGLRAAAEALGARWRGPARTRLRRRQVEAEQASRTPSAASWSRLAATSLRDGGQGISSLAGAGPGGGQGGRPMQKAA